MYLWKGEWCISPVASKKCSVLPVHRAGGCNVGERLELQSCSCTLTEMNDMENVNIVLVFAAWKCSRKVEGKLQWGRYSPELLRILWEKRCAINHKNAGHVKHFLQCKNFMPKHISRWVLFANRCLHIWICSSLKYNYHCGFFVFVF